MMKKLLILLIVSGIIAGCGTRPDREQLPASEKMFGMIDKEQFKPRAYRKQYFDHAPRGDASYDQGFQDGCQTATSAIGEGLARTRGPKFDGFRLTEDPWYLRGYQDASTYCTLGLDWETH